MAFSVISWVLLFSLAAHGETQETPAEGKTRGPATYRVTCPSVMRRGLPLPVSVHFLVSGQRSTVYVSLRNSTDGHVYAAAEAQEVTGGDTPVVITLMVPRDLKVPDDNDYYTFWSYSRQFEVRVEAIGDVTLNGSMPMTLQEKSFSIFLQTDKAMYKPADTVRIRILAMNPDLTVLNEPMDVLIRDPRNNVMRQWKGVQAAYSGVVELSMPTSDRLVLGDWTIEAKILGVKESQTFTVAEYVLPKFEATVDVPAVVLDTDPVKGTASAKYTFGKPFVGATAVVTAKFPYYWYEEPQPNITIAGTLDSKGEFGFKFKNSELLRLLNETYRITWSVPTLAYESVKIIVNITDPATGRQMGAETEVSFEQFLAKLEFLPVAAYNFKPGLQYTAYLQVTRYDGTNFENPESITVSFEVSITRPNNTATNITATTTTTTTTPSPVTSANETAIEPALENIRIGRPWYPVYWEPEYTEQFTVTRVLTANGFLSLDVNIPEDAKSISIQATAMNATAYTSASRSNSPSSNFLQLQLTSRNPAVGQEVEFTVSTTESVRFITYQVYAKGTMVLESKVVSPVAGGSQNFSISFLLTAVMAPNCRLLAFYLRNDTGEVVADSLSISVNGTSDNPVNLQFSVETAKPGDSVNLVISAKPNTTVFMLSVDKSVKLLKSGNDITQEKVTEELVTYDFGSGYGGFWRYMFICGWPYPSRGSDAKKVFNDANVNMLTDGDLYEEPYRYDGPFYAFAAKGAVAEDASAFRVAAPAPSSDVERIRKFFPETWLWSLVIVGASGNYILPEIAPDTVTSWVTTAFAVHPQYGLSVTAAPAELTTFLPLFLSLNLPYAAIRGEDICLKAFAFNYYPTPLAMTLTMGRTNGIQNIKVRRSTQSATGVEEVRTSVTVSHNLGRVPPDQVRDTDFCFTPTKLGSLPIRVNLTTPTVPGDGVEQMLLVKPEGTPKTQAEYFILDVKAGVTFSRSVSIVFPSDIVQGSQRISADIAGNLLGPAAENVGNLLRMPYGCGEQNMIFFAPNVFVLLYLKRTNTYTPEVAAKAQDYMLKGYQGEITYQHKDGSYSAFGDQDGKPGSMWLTAFVTKCFAQAFALGLDVISIDPEVVKLSLRWMTSVQNENGSFPEPGIVYHKEMQGGSATGASMTAYVLIALLESFRASIGLGDLESQVRNSIVRAQAYLESQLSQLTDSYDLAIVTYALHLGDSTQKDVALSLLQEGAISESLTTHWERAQLATSLPRYPWESQTNAINVEMTAYALLTYALRNDISSSLPIMRWLTSVQGSQGGFVSTQDTILALQALSNLVALLYKPSPAPIYVTISWTSGERRHRANVTIDQSNRILLQQVEIPIKGNEIPSAVDIQARSSGNSSGMAVAAVVLNYNVGSKMNSTVFSLTYEVDRVDEASFILTVDVRRIDGQVGGMTVVEVGIPTGYSVDKDNPAYRVPGSQMEEESDQKAIFYYDELDLAGVSLTLPMSQTNGITLKEKSVQITVYSYYNPDEETSVYYDISGTQTTSTCDRLPTYEACSTQKKRSKN